MQVHDVASVIHEAVRQMQRLSAEEVSPSWDEAPAWMQESTLAGIEGVIAGNTPRESHEAWMATRLADGWTLGPVKSIEDKVSPNLIPYDELPELQRLKDDLFVGITHALLPTEVRA